MKIALLLSFIAGVSTIIGSLLIFLNIRKTSEFIVFSLSFSMVIMILVSLFDLIPNSIKLLIYNYGYFYGLLLIVLTFLLGYLSINKINSRIGTYGDSSLYKVGILSMISLILHNFPEGIAVFISGVTNIKLGIKLCVAIMLHNIPEGIAISVPLYYSGKGRGRVFFYTLISGLAEPLGALLSYIFLKNYINELFLSFLLIFVAGIMISLSINDILSEILKYNKKIYIIYGVMFSLILFTITLLI